MVPKPVLLLLFKIPRSNASASMNMCEFYAVAQNQTVMNLIWNTS